MSKVVVDSSVVIKWFVIGTAFRRVAAPTERLRRGRAGLLRTPPVLCRDGNIVWKKQRFQGLSVVDAQQVIDAFRRISFTATAASAMLEDAYRLAIAYQRSVYDAMYLALALRENCQLVTADQRLANALAAQFPCVVWVANWP